MISTTGSAKSAAHSNYGLSRSSALSTVRRHRMSSRCGRGALHEPANHPTQKPEPLLERLLHVRANEGSTTPCQAEIKNSPDRDAVRVNLAQTRRFGCSRAPSLRHARGPPSIDHPARSVGSQGNRELEFVDISR